MGNEITEEELNQLRTELTNTLTSQNDDLKSQILELRQALQMNMPHHNDDEDQ